jgi:putative ABC transport system permease protein
MGYTGFSTTVSQELAARPEVETATGLRTSPVQIDGKTDMIFAIDPSAAPAVWDFKESAGAVADLHGSGIAVHRDAAEEHGWKLGDRVVVTFPSVGDDVFTVQAIHDSDMIDHALVSMAASERDFVQPLDMQVYVKLAGGVSIEEARPALEEVVARYPNVKLQDQSQYADERAGAVNQLLNLVYALLALAVIIALIGIANTLALSIYERTRELGLLRAVGMTRGQLRATVRWEAVIMSLLGTTLGIVVGSFFGWALVTALEDQGFTRFELPPFQLLAIALLAAAAGVVTAIRPSRRAAKLDVLKAITSE